MKYLKPSILAFSIFLCFAFRLIDKELDDNLVKVGETIVFSNKPLSDKHFVTASMSRSADDGSSFRLKNDKEGNFSLTNINQPNGPKQDDFVVFGCTGQLSRFTDNITFTFEKQKKNYFLINLDSGKVVAVFDSIVYLKLVSRNRKGNPAEYYCHEKDNSSVKYRSYSPGLTDSQKNAVEQRPANDNINLTAVPQGMKRNELYASVHKEKTLAHFTTIECKIEGNKILNFPAGNYILCEGKSLTID